jgi:phosphonate transport system substrate-binding protein
MCRELTSYLSQRLGLDAELVDDVPWQERERMLDAGAIDLCWICGLPYVHKADRGQPLELCVAPVMQGIRYGDLPIYFSDVLVRNDSRFESFSDLEGATWAYNEPRSHSGFNLVCYHLARRGLTLDYFSRLVEAGAHQAALRLIVSGEVSAAAIDSTVLEAELRSSPAFTSMVRIIDTLGPSPAPPWVISTRIPSGSRARIRQCLLGMCDDDAGRGILESWGISQLRAVDDVAYDPIREMAQAALSAIPRTAGSRDHGTTRAMVHRSVGDR